MWKSDRSSTEGRFGLERAIMAIESSSKKASGGGWKSSSVIETSKRDELFKWRYMSKFSGDAAESQNESLRMLVYENSSLMHVQADLASAQAGSGRAQGCSPIAQAKAATAQLQRQKWKISRKHSHVGLAVPPPKCLLFPILGISHASSAAFAHARLRLGSG